MQTKEKAPIREDRRLKLGVLAAVNARDRTFTSLSFAYVATIDCDAKVVTG